MAEAPTAKASTAEAPMTSEAVSEGQCIGWN
jgi:hypothetical protein